MALHGTAVFRGVGKLGREGGRLNLKGPKGANDSGINRPYMPNFTSFGYICMNFI